MRKIKKKRSPNRSYSGESPELPVEIVILDEPSEVQMLFVLSNRGLKMIKSGLTREKVFLKEGRTHKMVLMHREIYDEKYKPLVDMKKRHLIEKQRQEIEEEKKTETETEKE